MQAAANQKWESPSLGENYMKVLLQDPDTRLYFKGLGGWTNDLTEALDFENTSRAIEFWKDNDLLNVQIVLKYNDTKYDVVLDVLPPRPRSNSHPRT